MALKMIRVRRHLRSGHDPLHLLISTMALGIVVIAIIADSTLLLARSNEAAIPRNLLLQIGLLGVFWWWSTLRGGTFLNAPFVFVLAIFFWHSSYLAGRYLHLDPLFEYSGIFLTYGQEFVPAATGLISMCMALAVVGSVIAFGQRILETPALGRQIVSRNPHGTPAVHRYAMVLFGAYVLLTVVYLLKEGAAPQDYLDTYTLASGSVLYRVYQMTKFLGVPFIALLIATADNKMSATLAYAGSAFLVFTSLLSGARSMPFLYCATVLIAIDYFRKRVPFSAIVAVIFLASAASSVITHARYAYGTGLQMFTFSRGDEQISLWGLFWSCGATTSTVLRTMAFMGRTGLQYGRSFADAFVYVIPGPIVKMIVPYWTVDPPSNWLISQSADTVAGEGLGYSLVAEVFLNFGVWGCLLFLVIGWLIAYQYFGYRFRRDIFAALQSLNLVVLLSLHLRNDSITYVRVLIWGALVIWFARVIDGRSRARITERVQPSDDLARPRTIPSPAPRGAA